MRFSRSQSRAAFALALAASIAACGKVKNRDELVLIVGEASGQTAGTGEQTTGELLQQIGEVYDLYSGPDGLSREEMTNLMTRFGSGTHSGIVDALFRFDRDANSRVTVSEIETGLSTAVPALAWIPSRGESATEAQLEAGIAVDYPAAAAEARRSLARTLMALDSREAGGNGNGLLSRKEISLAALLMGGVEPATLLGDPILAMKLTQQVTLWNPSVPFSALSETNARLETMNFVARFVVSEKIAKRMMIPVKGDLLAVATRAARIAGSGPWNPEGLFRYAARFDGRLMTGDGDGNLSKIEFLNFLTDLEFAATVLGRGPTTPAIWLMRPQLRVIFPRVAIDLFYDPRNGQPRDKYWNAGLREFDQGFGGDRDGRLSPIEVGTALYAARILDGMFERLDADGNQQLNHDEGFELLKLIGITDRDAVDYLFADPPLDLSESSSTLALRMHTPGRTVLRTMGPWQVYVRMRKFLLR